MLPNPSRPTGQKTTPKKRKRSAPDPEAKELRENLARTERYHRQLRKGK
jgi:hypothetical protein